MILWNVVIWKEEEEEVDVKEEEEVDAKDEEEVDGRKKKKRLPWSHGDAMLVTIEKWWK